jgi:hypothetical protein
MTMGRKAMAQLARWLAAVLVGTTVGVLGAFALQSLSEVLPTSTPTSAVQTTTTSAATTALRTGADSTSELLMLWTPGGLPEDFAELVEGLSGVESVTEVRADLLLVDDVFDSSGQLVADPGEGWFLPVEAAAIDDKFASLAPGDWRQTLAELGPGEALISETAARTRGVGAGATIVTRSAHRVVAVLPDEVVGGMELVVAQVDAEMLGITTPRYLLISYQGNRAALERSFPQGYKPVRIRAPGETPFLRHGDAVLPQLIIKENFGEFAIRPLRSGGVEFDQAWAQANIQTTEYPLLGSVACHSGITEALTGAMEELERNNLGSLIESFDGCFNPRFIAGSQLLSRHAWGVAIDLNYRANPTGQITVQDRRLVETMKRWGFGWGGNWLVPDAAHFEWISPPSD